MRTRWSGGLAVFITCALLIPAVAVAADPSAGPGELASQAQAQAQQRQLASYRATPEQQAARARSRGQYSGESGDQAAQTVRDTHADVVDVRPFGLGLRAGDRLRSFVSDHAAAITTADGHHAVVASTVPLRVGGTGGRDVPVDLTLGDQGDALRPLQPLVPVSIAKSAAGGVSFSDAGIRVVPVDASGGAVGGDPARMVGSTAFFANVGADSDLLVRATPYGFETLTQIRSAAAPAVYGLRLALPTGYRLVQQTGGARAVEVVHEGKPVLLVSPATAWDGDGVAVPVTMSVSADTIWMRIDHAGGDWKYPLMLDPSFSYTPAFQTDQLGNWLYSTNNNNAFQNCICGNPWGIGPTIEDTTSQPFSAGAGGTWSYQTQGVSHIYQALEYLDSTAQNGSVYAYGFTTTSPTGAPEESYAGQSSNSSPMLTICPSNSCNNTSVGAQGNVLDFQAVASSNSPCGSFCYTNYFLWAMDNVNINIEQDQGPSVSAAQSPSGWTNDPTQPISFNASDPGVGINAYSLTLNGDSTSSPSWTGAINPNLQANASGCKDVQCPEALNAAPPPAASMYTTVQNLPTGVDTITGTAQNATGASATATATVKFDNTPPAVSLSGSLYDNRNQTLSSGTYQLVVNATDGNSASPSTEQSGVASVEIDVDGQQVSDSQQPCDNSCPMQQTLTFDTSQYQPGQHWVDVYADDQLGQESQQTLIINTGPCCTSSSGSWASGHYSPFEDDGYGDVTGNGPADLVSRNKASGEVDVSLSNGLSSFGSPTKWGTWPSLLPNVDFRVSDVNGDGLADLVGRDPSTGNVYVALSDGSSFGTPTVWGATSTSDDYYLASLDNTGREALITRNKTTGVVSAADLNDAGDGWETPVALTTIPAGDRLFFGNVAAGGAESIIGYDPSTGTVEVSTPQGDAYASPTVWGTLPTKVDAAVAQMDGSGLDAIVTRDQSSGQITMYPSNGSNFGAGVAWGSLATDHSFNLADVTGNGEADAVGNNDTGDVTTLVNNLQTPLNEEAPFAPDTSSLVYDTLSSGNDLQAAGGGTEPLASTAAASHMTLGGEADSNILATSSPGVLNSGAFDVAAGRIEQAGAKVIRMIVYWGRWVSDANYRSVLDQAVQRAEAGGDGVYLTLSGAHYDSVTGTGGVVKTTSDFVAGGSDGWSGDPDIRPSSYASFVSAIVGHFKQLVAQGSITTPILGYGIWDEPNSQSRTFLAADCTSPYNGGTPYRARVLTAGLYAVLYQDAYAAARSADPNAHIYFGELNGVAQGGRRTCSSRSTGLDMVRWIDEVANDATQPILTKGVAWHAYEHYNPPSSGAINDGPINKQYFGIGRIREVEAEITNLAKSGKLLVRPAASGQKNIAPALYVTEFGYLNLPAKGDPPKPANIKSIHPEGLRAKLYQAALNWATRPIRRGQRAAAPALFNLYDFVETGAKDSSGYWRAEFDTGLVGPNSEVTGQRPYGLNPSNPFDPSLGFSQPRAAYCALWNWAAGHGYNAVKPATGDHC